LLLKPFGPDDLETVAPWFQDAETQRWLGGAGWPRLCISLAGPMRRVYLGLDIELAVGLIDIEIHPDRRASFANVIAPEHRGKGFGTALLRAMVAEPALEDIEEFFAGTERGNVASRRLLERCGFHAVTGEDEEGFTYFALRRRGAPTRPWSLPA